MVAVIRRLTAKGNDEEGEEEEDLNIATNVVPVFTHKDIK
jgi:hypothetical protein